MKENKIFENNSKFKIETFETLNGNFVSYCPERGIITSLKLNGEEIIYMDEETLQNKEVNVKGGIPVLFPNAGPIPEELKTEEFANLKQHGFARDQKWKFSKTNEEMRAILISNEETRKVFPYDFVLSLITKFEKDGSVTIILEVENSEKEKEMPISMGLHPYFKVPTEFKKDIKFNFEGGKFIEESIEKWGNGKAVNLDNPNTPMEVQVPNLGKLTYKTSPEYKRIWVWSQANKDFFCLEPVMRDKGGIITDPEKIKPSQKFSASINISLEK